MSLPVIRVEGIKGLRRALREVDRTAPRELRKINKRVVEDIIIPPARERGSKTRTNLAGRPTRLGSRGVATIRPRVDQTRAAVQMGGPRAPHAFGHEWGAKRYRQFPPASKEGYILYPTIQERQDEILEAYAEAFEELIDRYLTEG